MKRSSLLWRSLTLALVACNHTSSPTEDGEQSLSDGGQQVETMESSDTAVDAGDDTGLFSPDSEISMEAESNLPSAPEPGRCRPMLGPVWEELAGNAQVISEGVVLAGNPLKVIGDHVYLGYFPGNLPEQTLSRISLEGGELETVFAGTENEEFELSNTHVYWATESDRELGHSVRWRRPLDDPSAAPEQIGALNPSPPLAFSGDSLYGYEPVQGLFWRQDFVSGVVTEIGTRPGLGPRSMVLTDEHIYFPNDAREFDSFHRISLFDGMLEEVSVANWVARPLLIVDDEAYWGAAGAIYATPLSPLGETRQLARTSSNDPRSNLATEPVRLHVYGDKVYWVDDDGSVSWATLDRTDCDGLVSTEFSDRFNIAYFMHDKWLYIMDKPNFEPDTLYRIELP